MDIPYRGGWSISSAGARAKQWLEAFPFLAALLTITAAATFPATDPDVWWHLATGRYIVAERRIPAVDVFSYTASTHRWVTHEWLSDLILYGGHRLAGFAVLIPLFALIVAAAYTLVFLRCRSTPLMAACSVLLAALASSMTWGVRPQMFSLFFASLYLYILDKAPTEGGRLWLLAPLTVLWANLHSGFVAGLAIIAVFVVGQELSWLGRRAGQGPWIAPHVKRLALVGLASAACSLITPNGLSAALFPFGTLSNSLIQANIQEWFSPNFHAPFTWPLAGYWLTLLGTLALSRRRISATELLLLTGAAIAALYSVRHVPFLSLVGAPILAHQAEDLRSPASRPSLASRARGPLFPALVAVALGALLVVNASRIVNSVREQPEAERKVQPAAALAYIGEHGLGGRIFNTYHWGGYLIWHGYPVFIDGRAELYGDEVLGEYLKAHAVRPDWHSPFQRYGVEVALVETDSRLAVLLKASGQWEPVYRDDLATVFVPASEAREYGTGSIGGTSEGARRIVSAGQGASVPDPRETGP